MPLPYKSSDQQVLNALQQRLDGSSTIIISYTDIAELTGLDIRSVERAIARLDRYQFIRKDFRPGRACIYQVLA